MKSFKKIISTITAVMMLGAMAVMPAQAAEGVRVDPTTFYADTDGIEVKVTGGTLDASDITLTKKSDGSTVTVDAVSTDADGVATISAGVETGVKYVITIGEVTRQFEVTAVVDGIDANTFKSKNESYATPAGAELKNGEYFMHYTSTGLNAAAETVKTLERYTVSYDYAMYKPNSNAWRHTIMWNSTKNGTSYPVKAGGYGFYSQNNIYGFSYLQTINKGTYTPTNVASTSLYINCDNCGTASDTGQLSEGNYVLTVSANPTKYWPIKLKKNGAKGTLFIDGNEIYTYNPGEGAETTGYLEFGQDNYIIASMSNFLLTTSKFAEVKNVTITDLYADADGVEFTSTGSTFTQEDVTLKTKAGDTIEIKSVTTAADGITTVVPATALPADTDYVLTVGEGTKEFRIRAVVNGINDLKPAFSTHDYKAPKGATIVDNKYFLRAAHLAVKDGAAAETVKKLNRYTVSYDYGRYDGGYNWGQRILWNATANGTANSPYPTDGYGFHMSYNALAIHGNSAIKNSLLKTVSPATTAADTTVKSTNLYVNEIERGEATESGIGSEYAVNVTKQPTKYWPIKIKKNGAKGTLFIDGHEIYTYDPGEGAPTTGYFVLIQDHTGFGSISNFLITTSDVIEPAVAPQIVGATRAGATVTFTVKGNTVESAWVGFALYGANNKFLGIASATYTLTTEGESKTLTVSGVNPSDIVTAKMFMWDNITDSLQPLCNVVTPTVAN